MRPEVVLMRPASLRDARREAEIGRAGGFIQFRLFNPLLFVGKLFI